MRKEQSSADEEKFLKKRYSKENKYKKKSLRVNDDDESTETSESESSHENKENDFMLMAIEDLEMSCTEMNDEDAIVDMEGELMSALEEIDRLRIKKTQQKQLLIQYKTNGKDISLIKLELEEAKKIEETLKQKLAESKTRCEHLEKEVVIVKKDL